LTQQQLQTLSMARIQVDGFNEVVWQPQQTLLQALEDAAIPVRHSCRRGNCGACQAVVLSGEVAYLHEISYKIDDSVCLMCAAVPVGDVHLSLSESALKRVRK
jgi:ferredoxin